MKHHPLYKKIIKALSVVALLMIPIYIVFKLFIPGPVDQNSQEPYYVGASSCIECHKKEYEDWTGSDHDLARDTASAMSVIGDFANAEIKRNGQIHKAYKKGDEFFKLSKGYQELKNLEAVYKNITASVTK